MTYHGLPITNPSLLRHTNHWVSFAILLQLTLATDAKRCLYISLVRSHLMYCSQIWRPHLIHDIILIEKIQHRATKYILNDYSSCYRTRLIKLSLLPLMYIFELNDIIFFNFYIKKVLYSLSDNKLYVFQHRSNQIFFPQQIIS